MDGTEGLICEHVVNDTGSPIMIPVDPETQCRIINVVGNSVDERGPVPTDKRQAIHAEAPEFAGDSGHWYQGCRPPRPLCQGWKDW